jgi:hypothetical protein
MTPLGKMRKSRETQVRTAIIEREHPFKTAIRIALIVAMLFSLTPLVMILAH